MKKFLSILLALTMIIGLLPAIGALAADTTGQDKIVINQIYSGGNNSGATYYYDFVELYNPTDNPVSLQGLSIQKAAKTGTSWENFDFTSSHTIPSKGYFLLQCSGGDENGKDLPTPDASTKSINFGGEFKVALIKTANKFSKGANGEANATGVIDFVGAGSANKYETKAAAKIPNNTQSLIRTDGIDTNNNSQDFKLVDANPRNSSNSGSSGNEGDDSQEPEQLTLKPISDALAASSGDFMVKGVVTFFENSGGKYSVYIQDATGAICARVPVDGFNLALGDEITATGSRTTYKGLAQLDNATYEKTGAGTLTPVAKTIATLATTDVCTYVKISGTVTEVYDNNGKYANPNITIKDGDKTIQLYKAVVGDLDIKVGDQLEITGAVGIFNTTLQLRNNDASQLVVTPHTHIDTATKDHKCDICQAATGDAHEPAQGSHNCAYCGQPADSGCVDTTPKNHICDVCGEATGDAHTPATGSHNCGYCGQPADEGCVDTSEKDHVCDICGEPTGPAHTPATGSHNCGYCGKPADSGCVDGDDADHDCDICDKPNVKAHVDTDNNKMCDECNAALCEGEHIDEANGKDHKCDRCQADMGGECKAAEGTHACEYCGDVKSDCVDTTPKDHKCDICKTAMGGDCVAAEGEHTCDYCGAEKSQCSDSATDKDHKCDVCGKDNMNDHDWEDATTEAPKTCKICGKTEGEPLAPAGAGLITDISKLQDGDKIVIIATGYNRGLSTNQKSNNRGATDIIKTGNTVNLPEDLQVFIVHKLPNGKFTLECVNGDTAGKFIYGGETSNRLKAYDTVDDKGTWNITIAADGVATIKSIAGNRDWMRFNSSKEGLFACYGSGQQDISIYKVGYAGDAPQEVKATETNVAGIKNAADGDKLQIKGIVTNIYYATIYIQDETGAVKVVLGANFPGKVGDTIVVTGNKNSDGSIVGATYEASSGMTLTAKEITAANLSTLDVGVYVKIAGLTVTKVNVNDDDKITSIEFADGSVSLATNGTILSDDDIKVGDIVTITGTNAGNGKVWNVSYVVTTSGTGSEDDDNTDNEGDASEPTEGGNEGDASEPTEGGNSGNEGTTTPVTKPTVQANPVAGSKYIFGLHQTNEGKTLFFTGEMDGYYLAMSDDASKAVDVQMESVEGGYRLFFMKDGKKTYIDIIPRENAEGKVNVVLTETPTAVFTYDKALKTFTTNVVEKTWYLGTYGTFTTISASETWRITGDNASAVGVSQFVAHMYAMTTSNVPSNGDTTLPTIVALMVISAMGVVALVSKKKEF